MSPVCVTSQAARGPIGTFGASQVSAGPRACTPRAAAVAIGWRSRRGTRQGAPMVANVPPGTPATASRPATRSGCRSASAKAVLTPIEADSSSFC